MPDHTAPSRTPTLPPEDPCKSCGATLERIRSHGHGRDANGEPCPEAQPSLPYGYCSKCRDACDLPEHHPGCGVIDGRAVNHSAECLRRNREGDNPCHDFLRPPEVGRRGFQRWSSWLDNLSADSSAEMHEVDRARLLELAERFRATEDNPNPSPPPREHDYQCEHCQGFFAGEHYSLPDCNETGTGVALCARCIWEIASGPKRPRRTNDLTFETLHKAIEDIRRDALCSELGEALEPTAEQYYLLALGALDAAMRYVELARINQVRAVMAAQTGRR